MTHVLGQLTATLRGEALQQEYRATLETSRYNGEPVVVVQQRYSSGDWGGTGGRWYLSTLLERPSDSIAIDAGQQWVVSSGMLAVLNTAQEHTA